MQRKVFVLFLLPFVFFAFLHFKRTREEKKYRDFSITLKHFKSVYFKGDFFIAHRAYTTVPEGAYKATFFLNSPKDRFSNVELQIAKEKGRIIISSREEKIESFPVQYEISFSVVKRCEIEPRVLLYSGSRQIVVEKVNIEWERANFSFYKIGLFSVLGSFILLSVFYTLRESERWKFFLALFFLFCGFVLILRNYWVSDDAFITLRHVENFTQGFGPVFNVGERVEGFTHPLWFGILSLFRWLGVPAKGTAVIPGLILSFLTLYVLFFKIRPSDGSPSLNPAVIMLIGTNAFIDFGTSGLETALSYFLLVLFAKFIIEGKWRKQPFQTGLLAALLTLTRPDFGLFFLLLLALYIFEFFKKRIPFKTLICFLSAPCFLVGGYQVFRMGYYASFWPNPVYAKSASSSYFSHGIKYFFDFFQRSPAGGILVFALLGIFLDRKNKTLLVRRLFIFLAGVLHGFFVVRGGGDFMHGRFFLPSFILIAVSASGVFGRFFDKGLLTKNSCIAFVSMLFMVSLLVVPKQQSGEYLNYGTIADERYFYHRNEYFPLEFFFKDMLLFTDNPSAVTWKKMGKDYCQLARDSRLKIKTVFYWVGNLGFYSGKDVSILDRLGLTDPVVSRTAIAQRGRPGHEKHAPFGYLVLRRPTFATTPFILVSLR